MQDADQYIEQLKKRISELDTHLVLLFGSHASGIPGEDSDIDLLVYTLSMYKKFLEQDNEFAKDVRTKGKILYEGTSRTMA